MFWSNVENTEAYRKIGSTVRVRAGQELDFSRHVALLEKGLCALVTMTPEGNERVYMYFKPGNLMGFLRHVLPEHRYPRSHIYKTRNRIWARTDLVLTLMAADRFFDLVRSTPDCYRDFTVGLAQNLSNMLEHSSMVACESAPIRICAMLLEMCEAEGARLFLPRCFTQNEMANFLSLHKITVAKVLKALKDEGFIDRQGRRIEILRHDRLLQVVDRELCVRY